MAFLIGFFKKLVEFFQYFVNFVFSLPGILLGIITGLSSGFGFILSLWSAHTDQISEVEGYISNLDLQNSISTYGGDFMSIALYACSIDILMKCILAITGFFVIVFFAILSFAIDVFLPICVSILGWKIMVRLLRRFVPNNWLPDFTIDTPSLDWVGIAGNNGDGVVS